MYTHRLAHARHAYIRKESNGDRNMVDRAGTTNFQH